MAKTHIKFGATIAIAMLLTSGLSLIYAQNSADVILPSDVKNLKAFPGNKAVKLTWDAATDDVGVTNYIIDVGTQSVQSDEGEYNMPPIKIGNVTEHTIDNLFNDQTYYFSASAVDAAGNESESYAAEVSVTPKANATFEALEDNAAPQVTEVKAEDHVTVLVKFSEPVVLPLEGPESALTIEDALTKYRLEIQRAEIDSRDADGITVLLTTEPQEENAEYVLTAGIELEDAVGNPVVSGTSDTGSFRGSAKQKLVASTADVTAEEAEEPEEPPAPPADIEPPVVTGGTADFDDRISINFSEPIVFGENPKSHFALKKKGTEEMLEVKEVNLSVDSKTAYLTTAKQKGFEYEVVVSGVKDGTGNEIGAAGNSATVTGRGSSVEDLVPPEDVTRFTARIKDPKTNLVELKWNASKNSAGDLADQLLYQGEGRPAVGAFGDSTSLGTSTTQVELESLEGGKWYSFKITAKDTSDNESKGAITSLYLPKTGPGILAATLTALFMGLSRKRKR